SLSLGHGPRIKPRSRPENRFNQISLPRLPQLRGSVVGLSLLLAHPRAGAIHSVHVRGPRTTTAGRVRPVGAHVAQPPGPAPGERPRSLEAARRPVRPARAALGPP